MDQSMRGYYVVGDYVVEKQIGAGSFSTVWRARHRVHGTEVAIKEIVIAKLNSTLQESLKSEIIFLKRINHPNIIRLYDMIDMIQESGKIYIVLEYCKGGDLSMYLQQRRGRIPEATAKHFLHQLAEGLKILRDNSLMHRDLKPQNLLLSSNGDNSVLKIADFGLARYLQPTSLAETLCGSPLYMAPEVMQHKKYDTKADLWSIGIILFQLVTGKTPFTGRSQVELLQNILKSTELQFPPEAKDLSPQYMDLCRKLLRPVPVERLTFDEFFDHPCLSQRQPDESIRNRQSQRLLAGFPLSERNIEQSSQEDCLPFSLDDDPSSLEGTPSLPRRSTMKSMYGFSLDSKPERTDISTLVNGTDSSRYIGAPRQTEITGCRILSQVNVKESLKTTDLGLLNNHPKVVASLESIDQDYVIVSGPPMDLSSSASLSKPSHLPSKSGSPPRYTGNMNKKSSASMPIIGGTTGGGNHIGTLEKRLSPPGISQGSMDIAETFERPSSDCMTRISSLQNYAAAITELVKKLEDGKQLEAFSVQLVILAIWKQALHICHTHAASAIEGSPSSRTKRLRDKVHSLDVQESLDTPDVQGLRDICSQIERAFLQEVGHAEELAKLIQPGNLGMPDAMELIYQSAIDLGKSGAVDEYLGHIGSAAGYYSKSVHLLQFLLAEAPCLILNPPFSLTNSDRYRIKNYIDVLNNRQSISRSQRMAVLKAEDQPCRS